MLSQIRMRQSAFTPAERMAERYNIEPNVLDDLKQVYKIIYLPFVLEITTIFSGQVLKSQQEGMAQLMNILKEDLARL